MEAESRTNKVLYTIMAILTIGLLALIAVTILGTSAPTVSIEEKSREKGMCVAMEEEETYCINGYLYKKNPNFNKPATSSGLGLSKVDDRPYLPLNGLCNCPKPNPLDAKLVKEITAAKEALKKCEADLNITSQLATQDILTLQKQVEEMKPLCSKVEEEKVEVTPKVEEVKPEPIKQPKKEVKNGNTRNSKKQQQKKETRAK